MTKKAKIKSLKKKAEKNGFDNVQLMVTLSKRGLDVFGPVAYEALLFNKEFAQEVWGVKHIKVYQGEWKKKGEKEKNLWSIPIYMYHLQQAVISEDPIDYYYKNM